MNKCAFIKLIALTLLLFVTNTVVANNERVSNVYDIGIYVNDIQKTKDFYTSVFNLKVVREWDTMEVSFDNETYTKVALKGIYLSGNNGMHLEFLQKAKPDERQINQEPINHFAIEVEDAQATYDLAISMGAKSAFSDERLQYAKLGSFKVKHTQILGLDGERIQILQVLSK